MRHSFIAFILICITILMLCPSCSSDEYTGYFRADEKEYIEALERNRTHDQAVLVADSLKSQLGEDWNTVRISSKYMYENGKKSRIRISDSDIYVNVGDVLKELRKYIGTAAGDISEWQKWGTFSDGWDMIESLSGFRYYRSV